MIDHELETRRMEFANLKVKWSTYVGYVPQWTEPIDLPSWEHIAQLKRELDRAIPMSEARLLSGRRD